MNRNVEIKARVADPAGLAERTRSIADEGPFEIQQTDTFFVCDNGRLKLRVFSPDRCELIFYRRANVEGPKKSQYVIARGNEPATLLEALTLAYGQAGRVVKHRTLYRVGQTRIHLDQVEGLGNFMELEVVLRDGQSNSSGASIASEIMQQLGVQETDLIDKAYVDLIGEPVRP